MWLMEASMDSASIFGEWRRGFVEHRFDADEWSGLTTEQRIERCNFMAEEAQKLAKAAPSEIAQTYLQIADEWLQLATEMQNGRGSSRTE